MRLFRVFVAVICLLVMICIPGFSNGESLNRRVIFEQRFQTWLDVRSAALLNGSYRGGGQREVQAIRDMGPEIIPFLVEKRETMDYPDDLNIELQCYIEEMTGKCHDQYPCSFLSLPESILWDVQSRLDLGWLEQGRNQTEAVFEKRYGDWVNLLTDGDSEESKQARNKIVDMGAEILPFVIRKIQDGDDRLISVVQELTHSQIGLPDIDWNRLNTKHEKIKAEPSREKLLSWWKENENRFKFSPAVAPKMGFVAIGDPQLKSKFDSSYHLWLIALSKWQKDNPSLRDVPVLPEMQSIIDMGSSIVPQLIAKMQDPSITIDQVRCLNAAMYLITWKRFTKTDWPTGTFADPKVKAQLYINWWKNDRKSAAQRFQSFYSDWEPAYRGQELVCQSDKWKSGLSGMWNMGIEAVPFIIEKIKAGDSRLAWMVSAMIPEAYLNERPTGDAVLSWWAKNQNKYKLPSAN